MGRQAFLTKIALGRSAFEPSQTLTQTSEYIQLPASQKEVPPEAQKANRYIQLYDERGNPTNPRSLEHGRGLRAAQNDVLASIGAIGRRRSPSQDLPGSYRERLQQLEDEDTAGNAIALASTLSETVCTWWVGSLRSRICTFRFDESLPFSRIVASELAISGKSIVNGGFTARLLQTVSIQATMYAAYMFKPLDRLFLWYRTSKKFKRSYRRWRNATKLGLRLSLEVLFYPLAYHSYLQRLGLVPARPMLPRLKSLLPFSAASPLLPLSVHYNASASVGLFVKAALTSPLVFICVEHIVERWIYSVVHEAIESIIIRPRNPDFPSSNYDIKARRSAFLGLRERSPPLVRNTIERLLVLIGWGEQDDSKPQDISQQRLVRSQATDQVQEGQTIEVGENRITGLHRLEITLAHQDGPVVPEAQEDAANIIPVAPLASGVPPMTAASRPQSPTASQTSQNDTDPQIRITSREGIVEMEVRLPSRVIFSHTEAEGSDVTTPDQANGPLADPWSTAEARQYHRVTHLSTEPAQMIGAMLRGQIVGWVTLPLRFVALRLVAGHYLAGSHDYTGPHRELDPFPSLSELSWSSVGVQVSRLALCGAIEFSLDLGLWFVQYVTVAYTGSKAFGWGAL